MKKCKLLLMTVCVYMFIGAFSEAGALDMETIECMSCHDAAIASDITLSVCSLPDCDHPIGVDYAAIAATNKGLRPASSLLPSIKLYSNTIGCGTCHVPYSQTNHQLLSLIRQNSPPAPDPMLVMDNTGSRLCLECHLK
ncbi:MAG: hypothetical protein HYS21_07390 [Deltaproteobacteria bacterium]|nr:hypothetical protein [Deltaproteobacteria bacterium]